MFGLRKKEINTKWFKYTESGIVTTQTFSDLVEALGSPINTISEKELKEKKIWLGGIRTLIKLEYLKKTDDGYELTEKGIKGYYENKVFREEVKKILKEKYGIIDNGG